MNKCKHCGNPLMRTVCGNVVDYVHMDYKKYCEVQLSVRNKVA